MKRDMDLIRLLLLRMEAVQTPAGSTELVRVSDPIFEFEQFDRNAAFYNFGVLADGGFINLSSREPMAAFAFHGLTWSGHEFLDKVRNPEVWRETKEGAMKFGGLSLDLLGAIAKGILKRQIEIHMGIKLDP